MTQTNRLPGELQSEINKLVKSFESKDPNQQNDARRSLVRIGEPAIGPLETAMRTNNLRVQQEIVKTLASMLSPKAAPVLVKQLENEDPDIRWQATERLIALGRKGLEPLLNALITNPDSLWRRVGGHHVLFDLYIGEVHESEGAFMPLYPLSDRLKEAIRPVMIAIESMYHGVLLPPAARKALEVLRKEEKG